MPDRYRFATAAVIAFVFVFAAQLSVSADTIRVYQVEDLGFIGSATYLVGVAMNAHGDVAGWGTGSDGVLRAFRWTASGGLEDLGTNGGQASMANGINDNGDVVGQYWSQDGTEFPFIARRGGVLTDLSGLYPEMLAINSINNQGQLTGSTRSGHAFRTLPDGALQEFGTYFSYGASLNDAGEVAGVGWHDLEMVLPQTAFRYSDATGYLDLGALPGGVSGARSINRGGVIVGWTGGTATVPARVFRAAPGRPVEDLGVLPGGFLGGNAAPYSINDSGAVVGQGDGRFGWSPFLYTDAHGMIDIRDRITTAERLVFSMDVATAINNAGQIVAGYSGSPAGNYGTVRLTPVLREFDGPVAAPIATPSVLRPANHRMVSVSIDPRVTDEYDPEPVCRIVRVVNSERPGSGPDPDVEITQLLSANLRATRDGSGDGRRYTIKLECTDVVGVTSTTNVLVFVPHDDRPDDRVK
jgi:uncharacterized membrane protein